MSEFPPVSRRDLLKTGLCSLCALSLTERSSGQGYMPRPVIPREDNPAIQYDPTRCQRCEECRLTCEEVQTVKGFPNAENDPEPCVYCGQCVNYCPAMAMTERFSFQEVARLLESKDAIPVALVAPSLPISVGEMYRLPVGTDLTAPLVKGLRKIGFQYVVDISAAADVTVIEEANELVRRLQGGTGPLPLLTSCCPSHVRFLELFFRDFLPNLSTVKSPMMMAAALIKTRFAEQNKLDPEKIVTVAFVPCTAKKYELTLPFGTASGRFHKSASMRDLDFALTTREAAYLLYGRGERLAPEDSDATESEAEKTLYDPPFGGASESGTMFGNTGGVTEAVLRTAYRILNGEAPGESFMKLDAVRGMTSVREAEIDLTPASSDPQSQKTEPEKTPGTENKRRKLKVAVVHGLGNAREFFDRLKAKELQYDLVEVMACRGGCIGGGGQPPMMTDSRDALRKERVAALYRRAEGKPVRVSGENPEIEALYRDFLVAPYSETARRLLYREG